jgi:hypothetical protein
MSNKSTPTTIYYCISYKFGHHATHSVHEVKNKKFNNTTDKKTPIPHGGRKQNKVWF